MADSSAPVTLMTSGMAVPSIAMEVLPFGLHVTKILLNASGRSHDVVIGPYSNTELVQDRKMLNCIVGRCTNRIPVGTHELEKGGAKGTLTTIANTNLPTVSIHGGPIGFDRLSWTKVSPTETKNFSSKEKETLALFDEDSLAIFSLTSADGDQGFPGTLYTEVLFAVLPLPDEKFRSNGDIELGALAIVYRSRLLSKTPIVTPINLTHHWGFNLSASILPSEEPTANKHWLRVDSSTRIELQPDLNPTGQIIETPKGSEWDWTSGKIIGQGAPPRYDGYLPFNRDQDKAQPVHLKLSEWEKGDLLSDIFSYAVKPTPVELYSDESGLRAEFQTNQPGVQFYGGEGLNGSGTKKKIHGGSPSGPGYTGRPAAYLEFHEPIAAWLHPYGAKGDTLLTTDEMYNNYIKAIFSYTQKL